jgi:MFS family permease
MFIVAWILYGSATVIRLFMAREAARLKADSSEKLSLAQLKQSLGAMGGLILAGGIVTWIFLSDGIRDVTFNMSFQLLPLYMQNLIGLSNIEIGWLSSIYAIGTMIFLTPAGWLSDRKGERVGIVVGFVLIAGAMALFVNSSIYIGFAVVWALFGVGSALIEPAYNSLISKVVPMRLRGTAFGVFSTSISLISLPAPYIGAMLWERFNPKLPFIIPLVTTLLLLPVMWIKFKLPKEEAVKGEAPA